MKPQAYLLLALLLAGFLVANAFAWQLGIGGRRDRTPGTELERYFGWPAVWRAELWDSSDPALGHRILKQAPFFWPGGEMQRQRRYTGAVAVAVDMAVLLLCCGLVVVFNLPVAGPIWRVGLGVAFVAGLLACSLLAQSAAAHL
jgi:hypothetical protein